MNLSINDAPREFADDLSLAQVVCELGMAERKGIAVAVNQSVVPSSLWAERELKDGDQIILIEAAQGG